MLLRTKDSFNVTRALVAVFCCTLFVSQSGVLFGQDEPEKPTSKLELQFKEGKPGKPAPPKKAEPSLPPLAQMLATALENNPDLGVAASQVQAAEAQLKRTRLNVVQQVMELRQAWETQQQLVAGARNRERALIKTNTAMKGAIPDIDLEEAKLNVIKAESKLAEIEAKIPYVLGTETAVVRVGAKGTAKELDPFQLQITNVPQRERRGKKARDASGRIKEALDEPSEAEFVDLPLNKAMEFIKDLHHIHIHVDTKAFEMGKEKGVKVSPIDRINLSVSGISLRGVLQAIEDQLKGVRFVVREYGILVTVAGAEPEGAITIHELGRGGKDGFKGGGGGFF